MDGNVILAVQHYFRRLLLAPSMDGNVILAVQHYFRRLLLAASMDGNVMPCGTALFQAFVTSAIYGQECVQVASRCCWSN